MNYRHTDVKPFKPYYKINTNFAKYLHEKLQIKTRKKSQSLSALSCLLANLHTISNTETKIFLPLRSNIYTEYPISYTSTKRCLKSLYNHHMIKISKGWYNITSCCGERTVIWPTSELLHHMQQNNIEISMFHPFRNEIILKNNKKEEIPYKESNLVKKLRKQLQIYNTVMMNIPVDIRIPIESIPENQIDAMIYGLQSGNLSVDGNDKQKYDKMNKMISNDVPIAVKRKSGIILSKIKKEKVDRPTPATVPVCTKMIQIRQKPCNFRDKLLKLKNRKSAPRLTPSAPVSLTVFRLTNLRHFRVFNNASFACGGRIYGPAHQDVSGEVRKHIFINNQPTVELDYSGLHIRMLYHMEGIDYRKECYVMEKGVDDDMRDKFKIVSLIGVNATNRKSAIGAVKYHIDCSEYPAKKLLSDFEQYHAPIKKYFYSGVGLKLQNMDSHIMMNVLISLLEKGCPCLGVHDSVIVPVWASELAKNTMMQAYLKYFSFEAVIK